MGLGSRDRGEFLGESFTDDTRLPPLGVENRDKWIAKLLNQRYYRLPEWVEVKARGLKSPADAFMRTVKGQGVFLDAGVTPITGAVVHWRIRICASGRGPLRPVPCSSRRFGGRRERTRSRSNSPKTTTDPVAGSTA